MVVGTFNPDTPCAIADFFYGRNFFWPAFANLFTYNEIRLQNRRMPPNGHPQGPLNPTLQEIFKLCSSLKLTFADLIVEVLHWNNPIYHFGQNCNVHHNGFEYNLVKDNGQGGVGGLADLHNQGQVRWNTKNIIQYLCANPQIKTIYFTRRPVNIWEEPWFSIVNHDCMKGRLACNIFTPSGAGAPVHRSMRRLLGHWIFNQDVNFGRLDQRWLETNGVTLNNFQV